jgi:hypothetical protein
VLKLIAANRSEQEAYLKKLGTYPLWDEIAFEFDDIFKMLNVENNPFGLPLETLSLLRRINTLFGEMSKSENTEMWYATKLDERAWENLSKLAERTLTTII